MEDGDQIASLIRGSRALRLVAVSVLPARLISQSWSSVLLLELRRSVFLLEKQI